MKPAARNLELCELISVRSAPLTYYLSRKWKIPRRSNSKSKQLQEKKNSRNGRKKSPASWNNRRSASCSRSSTRRHLVRGFTRCEGSESPGFLKVAKNSNTAYVEARSLYSVPRRSHSATGLCLTKSRPMRDLRLSSRAGEVRGWVKPKRFFRSPASP